MCSYMMFIFKILDLSEKHMHYGTMKDTVCNFSKCCLCHFDVYMYLKLFYVFLTLGISIQNAHVEEESRRQFSITARI